MRASAIRSIPLKMFLAVTIHNVPEGLAVGFAFGGAAVVGYFLAAGLSVAQPWFLAFTAAFTLLDDAITPIFFGFGIKETQAYFYASLPFMLTQCICTAISVGVLFFPL